MHGFCFVSRLHQPSMDDDIRMLNGLGKSDEWLVDALDAWTRAPAAIKRAVSMRPTIEGKLQLMNSVIKKYGGESASAFQVEASHPGICACKDLRRVLVNHQWQTL